MKRYYVLPALGLQGLVFVFAAVQLFFANTLVEQLAWFAVLVSCLPFLIYMAALALSGKGRASRIFWPHWAAILLAVVICLSVSGFIPLVLVICSAVILILYDRWYSTLERPVTSQLELGAEFPEWQCVDLEGNIQHSKEWLGVRNLLLFVRGNWCPLCVAQVKEVAEQYRHIADQGIQIRVIASQGAKEMQSLARRFDVPMQFLIDDQGSNSDRLGLRHTGGVPWGMLGYGEHTLLPTIIVTDEAGVIRFIDLTENYRHRPEPLQFLSVFRPSIT